MRRIVSRFSIAIVLASACTRAPAPQLTPVPAAPQPAGTPVQHAVVNPPAAAPAIPPVPFVDGALAIHVVSPSRTELMPRVDSTFIFGSVGSGAARLTVNGVPVTVHPNGAFLAFLPLPTGDVPAYELTAVRGTDSVALHLPIRLRAAPMPLPDTGRLVVDAGSVAPAGDLALRGDELVRVSLRAPANATVQLRISDGTTVALRRGSSVTWSADVPALELARAGTVVVRRGRDSLLVRTGTVTVSDAMPRRWGELTAAADAAGSDTDRVVVLKPVAGGTYKWFVVPGTVVEITGQRGDQLRVRLDSQLEAWVGDKEIKSLPEGTPVPRRVAGNARVTTGDGWSDLRIPMGERPAHQVTPQRDALVLTLYGTVANTDIVNLATADPAIRDVTWEQVASDRARFTLHLRGAPFGYLVFWDRNALVLRVRHTPRVNAARPLQGRTIAVDAGHPPAGSTGPTGFYEGDGTLLVAEQLKPMLEALGATVLMTRTTRAPVALAERPVMARRANADAFVSIHLNAYAEGANPFRTTGTGTFFFLDQSEPLARAIQRGLVRHMGLRDLGINYDNLAVVRGSWMPSVLCEGLFVIIPEHEAALRTVEFQQRYARGIADGLLEYFATLGADR